MGARLKYAPSEFLMHRSLQKNNKKCLKKRRTVLHRHLVLLTCTSDKRVRKRHDVEWAVRAGFERCGNMSARTRLLCVGCGVRRRCPSLVAAICMAICCACACSFFVDII